MLYKLIKREMDCGHGIVSQVLIAGKASSLGHQGRQTGRNQLQQYIMNVSLKINHKLGGQNMRIHGFGELAPEAPAIWSRKPTMLIGIDVTHPQSMDANEPSIVGIVASMDACALAAFLWCCLVVSCTSCVLSFGAVSFFRLREGRDLTVSCHSTGAYRISYV